MNRSQKEIKYIGFYDLPERGFKRVAALPAVNKMDYICDALNRAGFNVHIVSPSWFGDNAASEGFTGQKTIQVSPGKKITFCPSFGTKNKFTRNIKIIYSLAWLLFWLLRKTRRNEKILVYHTPWLSFPIRCSNLFISFRIVLEVEEIYSDVTLIHPYFKNLEYDLIKSADYFVFSTELLNEKINNNKRPFLVLYGPYKIHKRIDKPPDDGRIHVLYTGIIDLNKAGAFNALEASRFLSDKYIMHILGFGEVEILEKRINELNKTNACKIVFDGSKSGEDFIRYCQRCHIGLSTQRMSGSYLETSFPSKIITYLGMGLRVVSCKIECVKKSLVNDILTYYEEDSPESIARAIMSVDLNSELDIVVLLCELDKRFRESIHNLFNDNIL